MDQIWYVVIVIEVDSHSGIIPSMLILGAC